MYEVEMGNGMIKRLISRSPVNKDQLIYTYDGNKRVVRIDYFDSTHTNFGSCLPSYGDKGVVNSISWFKHDGDRRIAIRKLLFTYHSDGNLAKKKRPARKR